MAILPPARQGMYAGAQSLSGMPTSDMLPIPNASDSNYYKSAIGPINWNSAGSYGSTSLPHPGDEETTADASVLPTTAGRYGFAASYHDPYLRGRPEDNYGNSSAAGSFTTRTPGRARIAAEALTRRLAYQSTGRTT